MKREPAKSLKMCRLESGQRWLPGWSQMESLAVLGSRGSLCSARPPAWLWVPAAVFTALPSFLPHLMRSFLPAPQPGCSRGDVEHCVRSQAGRAFGITPPPPRGGPGRAGASLLTFESPRSGSREAARGPLSSWGPAEVNRAAGPGAALVRLGREACGRGPARGPSWSAPSFPSTPGLLRTANCFMHSLTLSPGVSAPRGCSGA